MLLSKKRFQNIKKSKNQSQKKYKKKRNNKKKRRKKRSFRKRGGKRKLNLKNNSVKRYKYKKGGAKGLIYLFPPTSQNSTVFNLVQINNTEMKDLKDGLFKKKECTSCYNTIKEAAFKFRDFAPNQNTMDCVELCDCGNSKISESVDKQGEGTCHYCLGKLRKKDLPAYPESATIEEMGEFVKERQKLCDNKFNKIGDITFNNLPSTEYFHKLLYVLLMLQLRDPNIKPKKLLEILNKFNPINEEELGKFMTELGIKQKSIVSAPVIVPPMPEVPDTKLPDVTKPFPECTNKCKKWFISEDTDNSKITRESRKYQSLNSMERCYFSMDK